MILLLARVLKPGDPGPQDFNPQRLKWRLPDGRDLVVELVHAVTAAFEIEPEPGQ